MQRLITSNIEPADHPINSLPKRLKIKYLLGLGEALCAIEPNRQMGYKAKFCYDVLCKTLLGEVLTDGWQQSKDNKNIKAAQSLCRTGLRFFRMSDCFWWDVYRIAYQSGFPISLQIYDKILKVSTGVFSRKYRESAKNHFFNGGDGTYLPNILTGQSTKNLAFHNKPTRRVLIVGTMSAGKSTLVNALIGHEIARVRTSVCTKAISYLYNNPFIESQICIDNNGSIRLNNKESISEDSKCNAIKFTGLLKDQPFVIIDTPGVDFAYDDSHKEITYNAIISKDYDILLCVVNAPYYERDGENELIDYITSLKNKKILFIFNQLDRFKPKDDSIEESLKKFKTLLKSKECNVKVIPISAKTAYLLTQEQNQNVDELDAFELTLLKERLSLDYYDLGKYGSGRHSNESDFFSRCGLTNLVTTLQEQ